MSMFVVGETVRALLLRKESRRVPGKIMLHGQTQADSFDSATFLLCEENVGRTDASGSCIRRESKLALRLPLRSE